MSAVEHRAAEVSRAGWSIGDSRELYNVEGWGIGYFDINEKGHLTVHPTKESDRGLDLFELAMDLEAQGVGLPLLLRFADILAPGSRRYPTASRPRSASSSTTANTRSSIRSR